MLNAPTLEKLHALKLHPHLRSIGPARHARATPSVAPGDGWRYLQRQRHTVTSSGISGG
jgi:hypothetical protein